MKTRFLIIIAAFLVLLPWFQGFDIGMSNEVMMDGIITSAIAVMIITIIFSLVSWFLFSWASKNIKFAGITLSIITSASLVIPFLQVLGPMAAVIIGVVAGFAAFMVQKKMTNPAENKFLLVAIITIVVTYSILITMILMTQTNSIWDTGDGIGAWTGTAELLENPGFYTILRNHVGFVFFLAIIPSLIITGLIIRGKRREVKDK
jgi:Amt family ammonium transporter